MNTKVIIVLPNWPQNNATTNKLRLLRQVPIDTLVFTNSSALGKRHVVVKVPWHRNYWVIDKDTSAKVSPLHVNSDVTSLNVGNANSKSDIASQVCYMIRQQL
jgi:hypothetical protein